ncbi:MAG: MATE family efflux transporter [Chloroflexota bacterium]|nr:MAG: MATE family efflux transporter [Chloroflexota bacterium]
MARQLYGLAWPAFAESALQALLGVVSMALVGQLGTEAVASVGLANQIYFVTVTVMMGWSIGTTALVARQVGAGQKQTAATVAMQSTVIGGALSLVMLAGAYPSAHLALVAAGATPTVAAVGEPFLRILSLSIPGMALMLVCGAALRGSGDTRSPMYVTAIANGINIVLAYALVLGNLGAPALGVAGAGLAIVIARGIGAILLLTIAARRFGVRLDALRDATLAWRVARIGGPAAAEQLAVQMGFLAFNLIAIRIGTAEFAAMQIAFNAAQVSQLAGQAFATAATTLVGQRLGAGRPDQARTAGWLSTGMAVVWMTLMGLVFIAFGDQIFRLYGADDLVRERGRLALLVMGIGQAPQAVSFVLSGALRGAGDTRTTLVGGLIGTVGLRAGVAYGLGIVAGVGYPAIWLAWLADWLTRSVIFAYRFRSGRWQKVRV